MHISEAHGPEYCKSCHVRLDVVVLTFLEALPKRAPLMLYFLFVYYLVIYWVFIYSILTKQHT